MQLDEDTRSKYQREAPELLDAVTTGEAEWIMKRDPATDYCVKFEGGWCGIQKTRGTEFLGDACHFFPRITRSLGDTHLMTAALSCPEVARLALTGMEGMTHTEAQADRLPYSLTDYLPTGLTDAEALAIHRTLLEVASDDTATPERIMARLGSVARSLDMLGVTSWTAALGFYLKQADGRLPTPQEDPADPFNLLHALVGLLSAAKPSARPRLEQTITEIEAALHTSVNRDTLALDTADTSLSTYHWLHNAWQTQWAAPFVPVLRRWIQTQLAASLFPFAGLGNTLAERITIISVRYATVRLALMSCCHAHNGIPPEAEIIRAIQSIARFLDHLADPTLSLSIYTEAGWTLEARARGLLGDGVD